MPVNKEETRNVPCPSSFGVIDEPHEGCSLVSSVKHGGGCAHWYHGTGSLSC